MANLTTDLSTLPDVCLRHIVTFLEPQQCLSLALTFNSRLFWSVYPALRPFLRAKRTERHLIGLFKDNPYTSGIWPDKDLKHYEVAFDDTLKCFGLEGYYIRPGPPERQREYLRTHGELNGGLQWLEAHAKDWFADGVEDLSEEVSVERVDDLMRQAARLDLSVPKALENLLRNRELQSCVPSDAAWYFSLGKLLKVEIQRADSRGKECGYVARLYVDQQGCAYRHLWLDAFGGHAVLLASSDLDDGSEYFDDGDEEYPHSQQRTELSKREKEAGIGAAYLDAAKDFALESTEFEAWLFAYADICGEMTSWETQQT